MEYCYLGNSGLQVSRLALGADPFGTVLDEKLCQSIVDLYYEAGGNLIDTANIYGGGIQGTNSAMAGTSEKTVGKVIKGKRDKFIVATKGYWLMEDEVRPNSVGLSRTYLATQIEASLRRLGTDYIDLYQCHVWDFYTPIEETMQVLDDFVRAGKIRYVAASNFDGWHIVKANSYAQAANLTPIVSNQIWYNLAGRAAEHSIIPACRDQNVSIIAWGASAQGFLSGRYRRGADGPLPGTTMATSVKETEMGSWKNLAIDRNWDTLDALAYIAETHGATIPNVARRWLLQSGMCDVVLVGGSKPEHYQESMEVLELQLSEPEVRELTKVSEPPHPYPNCFYDLFCRHESKLYGGLR